MSTKIILGTIGALLACFLYKSYSDPSNDAVFMKLISTMVMGLFVGMLAIFYVLPALSYKASQSMYADSNAKVDKDLLHDARAYLAQGDHHNAVIEYRKALLKDPSNRLAWTDMAKLYAEKLDQPQLAVAALQEAYDEHRWEEEDGAFLLFRTSEWQLDDCDDQEAGVATLSKVIETYPQTRHSANAMQQLRELGLEITVETIEKV